jgi:hypothetical protein
MSVLFTEDGFNTSARNLGFKNMSFLFGLFILGVCFLGWILIFVTMAYFLPESNSLTLVGQYTVYNYTSSDGAFKIFLLSKEKLNQSILLTNENDITEKILVMRIPYD